MASKQTAFRLPDTVKRKLVKISKWHGLDNTATVINLINKEYQDHKQEIEDFIKNESNNTQAED